MIMPLWDEKRPNVGPHFVTWSLIGLNVVAFLLQRTQGDEFTYAYSAVPYEIAHGEDLVGEKPIQIDGQRVAIPHFHSFGDHLIYLTLLTSMFLHGGFMHLAGNMLYLWIFGDNIEDEMGPVRFLIFYLLCGLAAAAAHIVMNLNPPDSYIPMLGASGAISGVLGAYLILHPSNRVFVLIPRLGILPLPAVLVLGIWIVMQIVNSMTDQMGGVAFGAHIGGFVAGMALVFLFRGPGPVTTGRRYPR